MTASKPLHNWYIGTIGFGYDDWRDVFYPRGIKASGYLAHYSLIFNAVEIDSTFHAMPRAENLLRWAQMTPSEFRFCVKMPKEITHRPDLDQAGPALVEFIRIIRALEGKLAVILAQFPPSVHAAHLPLLDKFFALLPPDLRYAVEVRHQSWYTANPGEEEPCLPVAYGFFNNDYAGFAPGTANRFKALMNLPRTEFQPPQQSWLF
jgi:uncharacterized protein YecE (DUF72 family)